MITNTTFIPQSSILSQLSAEIYNIDLLYSKINFILHEDLYPLEKNSYHFIGQMFKRLVSSDRTVRAFASTFFKSCYQAEILSAGGANIAYLFGTALAEEIIKTPLEEINTCELFASFDDLIKQLKINFENNSIVSKPKDIESVVKQICGSDILLSNAIWEALNLAGLEGRIFVENGRQDNFIIELKEGYSFNLKPFNFMLEKNYWKQRNCKVLIVDGLVEKVSEIDHLLSKTLETKIPMIIIAHGFSEEVVATLKANQERNLLDVQPIRIPSDVDSINIVNDIAVVCGSTPVSSMKGDLIVFTKYDDLPIVDKIQLSLTECSIDNNKTKPAVAAQIKSILEKRQNYYLHEEVQELFDKRLRSLISKTVIIYLPNLSSIKNDEQRVKIDLSLRQTKTILNYGTINLLEEIEQFGKNKLLNASYDSTVSKTNLFLKQVLYNFSNKLTRENIKQVPIISGLGGIMLSGKAMLLFFTSSGFVKII